MELKELQKKIKKFSDLFNKLEKERDANVPNNIIFPYLKAVEELGEIGDLIVREFGIQRREKKIPNENFKNVLGQEIIDLMIPLFHLANGQAIDLEQEFIKNFEKIDKRWASNAY